MSALSYTHVNTWLCAAIRGAREIEARLMLSRANTQAQGSKPNDNPITLLVALGAVGAPGRVLRQFP